MYGILIVLYVVSMSSFPLTGNIPLDIQTTIDYVGAFMSPLMMIIKMIITIKVHTKCIQRPTHLILELGILLI